MPFIIYYVPDTVQGPTATLFLINSTVMVNFMCQLDWAMRCPDIWSNIIPDVTVKCLDEINI